MRGIEGDAAARYFGVFGLLLSEKSGFTFDGRNRRPPRDGVNALLSFVYSILGKDISGALQGVGLDPQVGFLHADRPGRDSLAQDVLEEFRAWWAAAVYSGDAVGAPFARGFGGISAVFDEIDHVNADYLRHFF